MSEPAGETDATPDGARVEQAPAKRWSGETKRKLAVAILVVLSLTFGSLAIGMAWGRAEDSWGKVDVHARAVGDRDERLGRNLVQTMDEFRRAEQLRTYLLTAGLVLAYGALALSIVGGSIVRWRQRRAAGEGQADAGAAGEAEARPRPPAEAPTR